MAKKTLTIVEELEKKVKPLMEEKWLPVFNKQARYLNNGIYQMGKHFSTDTRELFLIFVAHKENINYVGKNEKVESED